LARIVLLTDMVGYTALMFALYAVSADGVVVPDPGALDLARMSA
jgi:hypothetical protein